MKTRIVSAIVGIVLFVVVLFFLHSYIFNIAIAALCVLAVYELIHSTKYIKDNFLTIISLMFAALIPFLNMQIFKGQTTLIVGSFVLILFIFLMTQKFKFEQIAIVFMVSLLVPFAFSSIVMIRDLFQNWEIGLYYVLMVFICAWISDSGAYFIGRAFGRHKLAPNISPKKTVEGAIGGVVFCIICSIAFTYVYFEIMTNNMAQDGVAVNYSINLIALVCITFFASIIGIFGDLSASIVKRQCAIKDFGTIMPGHGGVIDRFDSVLFIAPLFYAILQINSVIVKIIV